MQIIGIVGGIASGKSAVAEELARLGAVVVHADQLGHEVLTEPEVIAAARERWGEEVLDAAGQLRREAIAARVFAPPPAGPAEKRFLERLTHPRIGRRVEAAIDQAQAAGAPTVVIDAALLLETGWDAWCNAVIFVHAPDERRREWAMNRGWSEAEWQAREAAQMPLEEKRSRCQYEIDNSGSLEELQRQTRQIWGRLA